MYVILNLPFLDFLNSFPHFLLLSHMMFCEMHFILLVKIGRFVHLQFLLSLFLDLEILEKLPITIWNSIHPIKYIGYTLLGKCKYTLIYIHFIIYCLNLNWFLYNNIASSFGVFFSLGWILFLNRKQKPAK